MARPGVRCCLIAVLLISYLVLIYLYTRDDKTFYSAKVPLHGVVEEYYQSRSFSNVTLSETPSFEIRRLLLLRLKAYYKSLPSNSMDIFNSFDIFFDPPQPWTALGINMTREVNKRVFRSAYESVTNSTYHNLMLTKKNPGDDVDPAIINELPQDILLPPPPYRTCAVVGSGGILTGSQCGAHIDKADFVFRFNLASVVGFEKDVGSKTNFTTMNPSIKIRYGGLKTDENATKFSHLFDGQTGFVWAPAASLNSTLNPLKRVNGLNPNLTFIGCNTRHFNAHREFWALFGLKKRPSTGFYFVNVALSLCSDVHLYGFWPFGQSLNNHAIPYHYHNEITVKMAARNHEMPVEFKMLLAMHRLGLVNLHVARCRS